MQHPTLVAKRLTLPPLHCLPAPYLAMAHCAALQALDSAQVQSGQLHMHCRHKLHVFSHKLPTTTKSRALSTIMTASGIDLLWLDQSFGKACLTERVHAGCVVRE